MLFNILSVLMVWTLKSSLFKREKTLLSFNTCDRICKGYSKKFIQGLFNNNKLIYFKTE